jgi:hypothetical protein
VSELRVQLRNGGPSALPLPGLRLTVLDDVQRPVAQRVLRPVEYAGHGKPALAAGATVEARVLLEAPEVRVAGFEVELAP